MARPSFFRRTVRKVLRGATWLKSVGRYNERFPQIFRADKWRPAGEGSVWMNLFGMRTSPLSLVGTRRRGRNNLQRLLRVEGLEQKQLLAVNVAVLDTGDDAAFAAIASQLNDNTHGFAITATVVQPAVLAAELVVTPGKYDVVVIGDDGTDPSLDTFTTIAPALNTWAKDFGGGIVAVGLVGFGVDGEPQEAAMDEIIPVPIAGNNPGYATSATSDVVDIIAIHPVTNLVGDITITGTLNFSEAYPSADFGTVLATISGGGQNGNVTAVAGVIPTGTDPGRSVYLGPIYSGLSTFYDTTQWRSGDGDRLLEQAVNWASNVLQPPVVTTNTGSTVTEGGTDPIISTELDATDPDTPDTGLKYTVTVAPLNGVIQVNGVPASMFTQDDINNSKVAYVHNGGETTTDSFTFDLTDGTTTVSDTFAITVNSVDDAPAVTTNTGSTAVQGGSDTITSGELDSTDPDTADTALTYTITSAPANGTMKVNGIAASSFTQQDITDGKVVYVHNGSATTSDTFAFQLSDGTTTVSDSFAITITPAFVATVKIAATDAAAEPNDDGFFTVTMSAPSATPTNVTYNVSGSATNGVDYQPLSGFLTIPAGATSAKIDVDVIDDSLVEGTENVFVALSTVSGDPGITIDTTADDASLNIADNDPTFAPPVITTNTGSTAAQGGTDVITQGELQTTDPDTPATGLTYTVTTAPVNGTLSSLTFTQAQINAGTVTYTHNGSATTSDSFAFNVTDGTTTVSGTFSITVQPGGLVSIAVSDGSAGEPANDGAFIVILSQPSATTTTITYNVLGTASNGTDYQMLSGFLQIPAGSTSAPLPVDIIDDSLVEGPETVLVALSTVSGSPGFGIDAANDEAQLTIADDDTVVASTITVTANDAAAAEVLSPGAPNPGSFRISISPTSGTATTVNYTISGTAANGTDYSTIASSAVIPANTAFVDIPINVIDDILVEGDETVTLTLTGSSGTPGATVNTTPATVTIADNDPIVTSTITVTANDAAAAEVLAPGAPNPGSFRISISPTSGTATTVNYTISGNATNGTDYSTIASSAVIPANTAFVDIPINVIDDIFVEGNETVTITLTSSSGTPGAAVNTTPATVTIADNEVAQVTIAATDPNAAEPADDGAFTVSLNQQSNTPTTVNLIISGSATNGADYVTIANTVIIPANTSSVVIPVDVIDDAANEASETVIVSITGTSNPGIAVGGASSATVNIADNENDPVVAGDDTFTTPENKTLTVNPPGVLANDFDPDGDTLQAALLSTTKFGSLAFLSNGGFTYTPNTNFDGTDEFTYRVFDGRGTFDDAKVTINVTIVNQNPIAVDDAFTTSRSQPVTGNVLVNDSDPDGDSPLFTGLATAPANGSVVLQSNGTFTYTPNSNIPVPPAKSATDSFEYLLSDGKGGTDIGKVVITVTAPVNVDAADDNFTAPEDFTITSVSSVPPPRVVVANLLANDVDPENDAAFSLVSNTAPTSGSLLTFPNGDFIYTPFRHFFGTDSFTYTIQDTKGFTDTAKVTLNITPVNDVEAVDDLYNINEGATLTTSAANGVLANDFDPDLNPEHRFPITRVVSFDATTTKGGTVSMNPNGSFTYIPASQFFGTDTFTYTITDDAASVSGGTVPTATDTATVTINVGGENDPPDAVNDSASVLEDSANNFIDVLQNDSDPDGDPFFVSAVTAPTNGSVTIVPGPNDPDPGEGGGIRYTPNPNFFGVDTFNYTISDGRGKSDTATVTVTVSDTPDVPSPVDDVFNNAIEDLNFTITEAQLLANDINPDKLAMIIALNDSKNHVGGKATLNPDRSITFDPNQDFTGAASFQYFISGAKADDPGLVTINFQPVNDPPSVVTDVFDTAINTPITVTTAQLLANDSDVEGGTLTVLSVSNPQNGTVVFNQATGQITFTPNMGFTSSVGNIASFNYTVTDNQGAFSTGQVIINVQFPNRPPVANDEIIRIVDEIGPDGSNHNRSTRIEFPRTELDDNDTDPDGDTVSFVELVAGSAIGGTVSLVGTNNVTVRFDTTVNFVGDASFEYKVTDGRGAFDIGKATIRVKDTNDPPDARNDTAMTAEDTKVDINVLANDLDADFANAAGPEFDEPNADGGDPGPVERLRVISVSAAGNGSATIGPGGVVSYLPNQDFNGIDSFSYTIADLGADNIAGTSDDATDSATVTITVGEANDVVARDDGTPDRIKINEDSIRNPINVLANDSDPEGQTFKITSVTQGTRGVVEIGPNGGNILYTPDPDFVGNDQFTYLITDSLGATDMATVFVVVIDQGEPPNAVDDVATVIEDSGPNVIDVRANDTDADNPLDPPPANSPPPADVKIVAVTQGSKGTVQIRTGGLDLVYTPNANFSGTDTFTYTLRDPGGAEDTATVTVTVVARPDVPDAVNDLATVIGGSTNNQINVLANDTDPDGDPLTIVSVTQGSKGGTVTIAPDSKSVRYTPNAGFSGDDAFTYTIQDPSGFTDTATVVVTVTPTGPDFFGTPADDIFLVRLDATATNIQVFNNATGAGSPIFSRARATAPQFSFTTGEGNDRVIVDLLNGDPLPSAGIRYDGGAGNDMFEVRDIGASSGVFTPSGTTAGTGTVALGTGFINLTNVEPIDITGLANFRYVTPNANDTLTLTSPAVNTAQLTGTSGAMALSTVTFRDVGTFIIDAGANDAGAGNDSLAVSPGVGRTLPNNVGFLEYRSGTGANTLNLTNGTARINSTVVAGGTLDTSVGANAELITTRFRQNSLTLGDGGRATVLQAGTPDAVSRLNSLSMGTGSKLDLNDNSLVIDFTDTNPANIQSAHDAIRNLIVQGRGGAGIGNGVWNGNGITSSAARAANLLNPESRSIGFAHNGSLPLGAYTNWRGQPVDTSTFLIGFTRTGDATLDSVVNDNDATILGAVYPLATGGTWATADFDYDLAVGDNDATLLGAFFEPNAAPFPAPAPAPAPLAAAGEAFFAEVGSGGSGSSSGGVNISAADLAALADEIFAEDDTITSKKTKFGV